LISLKYVVYPFIIFRNIYCNNSCMYR